MFEGVKRFAGNLFGGGGGSLPSNVGGVDNSVLKGGIGDLGYSGFKYDTSYLGDDFFTNKGRQGISNRDSFGGGFNFGNAFSGEKALEGFKGLLDISRAQGDRRTQGSYGQGFGFQGYGGSRAGQGALLGGTPGYSSSLYLPAETPYGGGGLAGGGGKPSRFAKVAGGAASGALMGMKAGSVGGMPGMAAGALIGGLGGLFS